MKYEILAEKHFGEKRGKWIISGPLSRDARNKILYTFTCECGFSAFRRYSSISYGCSTCTNKHHGMKYTRTYRIWAGMKARCYTPSSTSYGNYGARGIKVCEQWHVFDNFFADMGPCPVGLSLDRIDNNGDYEASNCKWSSYKDQANNRRKS